MKSINSTITRIGRPAGFLLSIIAAAAGLMAAEEPVLDPHLAPLQPWLEKTWRGEFRSSTPEKPIIDIARWERALNGKAVRILHSINNGFYGGESIITWDPKKESLVYHYFTTAGFMTTGTMTFEDGKCLTHEKVSGSSGGIEEVRGTTEMRADGTFLVKTEHLKGGEWTPGRETIYREDSSAKVTFK